MQRTVSSAHPKFNSLPRDAIFASQGCCGRLNKTKSIVPELFLVLGCLVISLLGLGEFSTFCVYWLFMMAVCAPGHMGTKRESPVFLIFGLTGFYLVRSANDAFGWNLSYVCTFLFADLLWLVLFLWEQTCLHRRSRPVPGDKSGWLLGFVPDFQKHIFERSYFEWRMNQMDKYGSVFQDRPPAIFDAQDGARVISICDPKDVEHVLKTNFFNYVKPPIFNQTFSELLGEGIFIANHGFCEDGGRKWKQQRKTSARIFTARNFREHFISCFLANGNVLLGVMEKQAVASAAAADTESAIDLQSLFFRFTLDCIASLGFGISLGCVAKDEQPPFAIAFDCVQQRAYERFADIFWSVPIYRLLSPAERKMRADLNLIDAFAKQVIKERRKDRTSHQKSDLLSLFLNARDENGNSIDYDDTSLRDIVMNILIAGRDTTACLLTWFFYMLSTNPSVQKKLLHEVDTVLNGRTPTYAELNNPHFLPWLHGCIGETLRLWPPVPVDPKFAVEDDVLPSGVHVAAGSTIQYMPYLMGRSKELWGPDAQEVNPERWSKERAKSISAFKFPVFQAGPRICLGMNMAQLESKVLAIMILQRYTIRILEPEKVTKKVGVTLGVHGKLLATVHRRAGAPACDE